MSAKVKCQYCEEKSPKDEMHCEAKPTGQFNKNGSEKMQRKYWHHDCFEKELKDREFKEKEQAELDELNATLIRIHNIKGFKDEDPKIPSTFFPFLQEIRNGTILFGQRVKKYKQGIRYKYINYTYLFCEENIEYARRTKEFKDLMAELRYCLAIVKNNIEDAARDLKRKNKQRERNKKIMEQKIEADTRKSSYEEINTSVETTNKDELDISDFL